MSNDNNEPGEKKKLSRESRSLALIVGVLIGIVLIFGLIAMLTHMLGA